MSEYRIFGPKAADHPSIGRDCSVCREPFREGDFTMLVGTEPGSEEDREKMLAGRPYTAHASEIHSSHMPDAERRERVAELKRAALELISAAEPPEDPTEVSEYAARLELAYSALDACTKWERASR